VQSNATSKVRNHAFLRHIHSLDLNAIISSICNGFAHVQAAVAQGLKGSANRRIRPLGHLSKPELTACNGCHVEEINSRRRRQQVESRPG
jgi:hypothetical protein